MYRARRTLSLDRGVKYASDREVFDRPIGKSQAIQYPLVEAYARLQAAKSMTYAAAWATEESSQQDIGGRANMSKFLAADAAYEAADAAVQAHGGFGVAHEYDVEWVPPRGKTRSARPHRAGTRSQLRR